MTKKTYQKAVFIFRRDLRIHDNTGLLQAMAEAETVIPVFIFTPQQVSTTNQYRSSNAIQFMTESLKDLDGEIENWTRGSRLWCYYGTETEALAKIYRTTKFEAVFVNRDYTPYAIRRDRQIKSFCRERKIDFHMATDYLLLDRNDMHAANGNKYRVFTIFYRQALKLPVRASQMLKSGLFARPPATVADIHEMDRILLKKKYYIFNPDIAVKAGRSEALRRLKIIPKIRNYKALRQDLGRETTKLSAYLKFGAISVREAYEAFGQERRGELRQNLYWRDFYYYVGVHFPQFYRYGYIGRDLAGRKFAWSRDGSHFKAWRQGATGFPVVDAAMREMNQTGFMHNRGRLIASSFLIKDLVIDWRHGERYFTRRLVDIDRAQNMGNWNWSASFGLDGSVFLRIMNPWTQSATFDPDCIYIKKWIPELRNVPPRHIHNWHRFHKDYPEIDYPKPIVDHAVQRLKFRQAYDQFTRKK